MGDSDSHKRRTLTGVAWNFVRVFGQTLASLGTGIVLARLLQPEDFGLLAVAMIFIGVADLVASVGMEPAVVQRKELTDQHLRVATTLSLISGSILTLIFWALAHPISLFFNEPRLEAIVPVLAVGLGFSATFASSRGLLIRQMDFRRLFLIDLVAYLVGYAGVAIGMALLGFGVWSLVIGTVVSLVIQSIAVAFVARPRWPLSLSSTEVKDLLGFGGEVSLNNTINYLGASVDYMVIGKFLDATVLGLYTRAYQLVSMPLNKIAGTIAMALFPSYAEVQHDRERLARVYLKTINATALVTFPILTGFAIAGELVVVGLYGEKWGMAVPAFRILALAGFFKTIFHLAGPVAQATDNVRGEIRRQLVYLVILAVGCYFLVEYGIEYVAWVVVVSSFWLYLSMAQLAGRIVGCSWGEFFRAQVPGVVLSGQLAVVLIPVVWIVLNYLKLSALFGLLIVVIVCMLTTAAGFLLLPKNLMGEMPGWIVRHFENRLPMSMRKWIEKKFPE